mmetsp:Transcript_7935/g.26358  ORF Transcript_7935/g.26358 Transcript_7935/m.26358 type:complete len:366 (+) Transcript_7935:89-1186(+)
MAAKAEGAGEGDVDSAFHLVLLGADDEVEVDCRVGVDEVWVGVDEAGVDGFDARHRLDCSGRAEEVPDHALGGVHLDAFVVCKDARDGAVLGEVAGGCGGGVRVDVVDVGGGDARVGERFVEAELHADAVGVRVGHVVRVAGVGAAEVLGVDGGSARLGVLEFLQHEHARSFAHHKPVAVDVPRPGRRRRVVVAFRERLGGGEARHADREHRRVRRAREHHVRVAVCDVHRRVLDAIVTRGARARDAVVWAHKPNLHRRHRGPHVRDAERDAERVHLAHAPRVERCHAPSKGAHAAHGAPNHRPAPRLVQIPLRRVHANARVLQSLLRSHQNVLDVLVQTPLHLFRDVPARVKVFDLPRETRRQL